MGLSVLLLLLFLLLSSIIFNVLLFSFSPLCSVLLYSALFCSVLFLFFFFIFISVSVHFFLLHCHERTHGYRSLFNDACKGKRSPHFPEFYTLYCMFVFRFPTPLSVPPHVQFFFFLLFLHLRSLLFFFCFLKKPPPKVRQEKQEREE